MWNDGTTLKESPRRRKHLRLAKYTSMVLVDSPWAPMWAINKVTFSAVIGWVVIFWYWPRLPYRLSLLIQLLLPPRSAEDLLPLK